MSPTVTVLPLAGFELLLTSTRGSHTVLGALAQLVVVSSHNGPGELGGVPLPLGLVAA